MVKQNFKTVQETVECLKNNNVNVNSFKQSKQLNMLIIDYFKSVEKSGAFASLGDYIKECSKAYGETLYLEYLIMQVLREEYERNNR